MKLAREWLALEKPQEAANMMKKIMLVLAALAAIGFAIPAYAESDDKSGIQPTLTAASPFSPEALAQAVAAVQQEQSATEAKLAEVDKRIADARRGISRGKKMVWWGLAAFGGGSALALIGAGDDSCFNYSGWELVPKGCTAREYAGVYIAGGGGGIAILGVKNWLTNTFRLRRAEAERERSVGADVEVTPTKVAAN